MKSQLGIVIQARMGSSRRPGKVLAEINDRSLLEHIFWRLQKLRSPAEIVVATTEKSEDDLIVDCCERNKILWFRGSEHHVLERYFRAAEKFQFSNVVRLTADNPFTDIEELDRLIELHEKSKADFSTSGSSLPLGVGAQIFTFESLKKSFEKATEPHQQEHADEYIWDHRVEFHIESLDVDPAKKFPEVRLTVDTEEDLRRARFVDAQAKLRPVQTLEALQLCSFFV